MWVFLLCNLTLFIKGAASNFSCFANLSHKSISALVKKYGPLPDSFSLFNKLRAVTEMGQDVTFYVYCSFAIFCYQKTACLELCCDGFVDLALHYGLKVLCSNPISSTGNKGPPKSFSISGCEHEEVRKRDPSSVWPDAYAKASVCESAGCHA